MPIRSIRWTVWSIMRGEHAGGRPQDSTIALTNATLPYAVQIANKGWKKAMKENPEIKLGANVVKRQGDLQRGFRRFWA